MVWSTQHIEEKTLSVQLLIIPMRHEWRLMAVYYVLKRRNKSYTHIKEILNSATTYQTGQVPLKPVPIMRIKYFYTVALFFYPHPFDKHRFRLTHRWCFQMLSGDSRMIIHSDAFESPTFLIAFDTAYMMIDFSNVSNLGTWTQLWTRVELFTSLNPRSFWPSK